MDSKLEKLHLGVNTCRLLYDPLHDGTNRTRLDRVQPVAGLNGFTKHLREDLTLEYKNKISVTLLMKKITDYWTIFMTGADEKE
jgi:hypothetical protein